MAVVSTLSNHFKYMLASGDIDFDADTFKIILMNTTFAFDKDADATLADVTADQLATNFGYTQDTKTLANVAITEDDSNDVASIAWDDVQWTASGGSIGASGAAIIYDDTTADDTVIGCIDYGQDVTATDGANFSIQDISLEIG
uniref:Uncharacterized protein n=1 Tax=viral metagenome TaxID=1070528 RepID=A0A6M3J2D0_9ZZZZ